MTNKVSIDRKPSGTEYRCLVRGAFFHALNPWDPSNVYIKTGTVATNLRTGESYSYDQQKTVIELPAGTILTIEVGAQHE